MILSYDPIQISKRLSVTIQIKATEQLVYVALFAVLQKMFLSLKSAVEESLARNHSFKITGRAVLPEVSLTSISFSRLNSLKKC